MTPDVDLEAAMLGPLVPGRSCGTCTACCVTLAIDQPELKKPANTPCPHLAEAGCALHPNWPELCRTWFCGWRRMAALGNEARPDRSGIIVSLNFARAPRNLFEGVAIVVRSLDGMAGFDTEVAEAIVDQLCDRLVPVWLDDGTRKYLIHPEEDVAALVLSGDPPPPELAPEVAAWRARYGVFR